MSYNNIPDELKRLNQWINWKYEEVTDGQGNIRVTKIPIRSIDGRSASVSNPLDWSSFERCIDAFDKSKFGDGIGFVFCKSDPYCGIDLDNSLGDDDVISRQAKIFQTLDSYSELSPSGNGLHIITKAALPGLGRRRGKVECYDNLRFFTFTGNVYHNRSIQERQSEILAIYESLGSPVQEVINDGSAPEHFTDIEVIDHAKAAVNGNKFQRLFEGDWQTDYFDKSQSEADFALINIIAFYSRNAIQTARIFRSSGLGKRQKAKRGDYISRMVARSFDRMPKTLVIPSGGIWFNAADWEPWSPKLSAETLGPAETVSWQPVGSPEQRPINGHPLPTGAPAVAKAVALAHADEWFPDPVPPPPIPGLVGDMAMHTWNMATHQIAEAAIASALSSMALLCGRSYRHGSMGLSLYLILLAQTSTGKSFAYQANDARFNTLVSYYRSLMPPFHQHGQVRAELLEKMIRRGIGSAPGLSQAFAKAPSMLFHLDEYVNSLRLMAMPNIQPNLAMIRDELLGLFEMSGPGRVYRGSVYSERSPSAPKPKDIIAASMNILATGTPEAFYDELSATLLTGGFMPRFVIMDYTGELARKNPNPVHDIDQSIIQRMAWLFDRAENLAPGFQGTVTDFQDVQGSPAVNNLLEDFDTYCLRNVQIANREHTNMAGMWSRAKEHVRKIASLIAIGVQPFSPQIEAGYVDIAVGIVMPALKKIELKIIKGETGNGDMREEAEIKRMISHMISKADTFNNGALRRDLLQQGLIQLSVLRNITTKRAVFTNNKKEGARKAFDNAIEALCKYGALKKCYAETDRSIVCVMIDRHF